VIEDRAAMRCHPTCGNFPGKLRLKKLVAPVEIAEILLKYSSGHAESYGSAVDN